AAGGRAHEPRGLQGGFGPRVAEAPEGEVEPVDQVLPHRVESLGGLGEVRPEARLPPDRLDDLRVRVAGDHGAVAEVEVDVLVAVDVPEAVAEAVIDEYRVRRRVLPAGGHAAGDRALGDFPILDRCPMLGFQPSFL